MSAIRGRALRKDFGTTHAVAGVDLAVERGEVFGVVGPDGAGKTTLLRLLAGALVPTGGELEVSGIDVRRDPEGIFSRVGYLSQRFSLYEDLTVAENLRFFADLRDVEPKAFAERRQELLRFTRLEPFTRRLAGALSGGMKQKLALAATLLHRPEVLVLDEPTTGVDPVSRREFWAILGDLRHEGITIVVSTPYMDEAERMTRVALMARGRFLDLGPPDTLRKRFPWPLVRLDLDRSLEAKLFLEREAAGTYPYLHVSGNHLRVGVPASAGDGRGLARALEKGGYAVAGFTPVEPDLEDAFMALLAAADEAEAA